VIELVGQRRQRSAARSATYDLAHQVAGQPIRQDCVRHPKEFSRGLPHAGQLSVIKHGQLSRYPRLETFQHRQVFSQRLSWSRCLLKDLPDHSGQVAGTQRIVRSRKLGTALPSGCPDRRGGGLPQRTLLLTAEYQLGQLLTTSVGKLLD
jgi:hypothetical protein